MECVVTADNLAGSRSEDSKHPTVRQRVHIDVSRSEFESHCAPLFDRAMEPVTRLLETLTMSTSDIDEVVLVGGTTRIPKVKQQLREFFGKEHLNDQIDPDITIAYGAASVLQ